MVKGQYEAFIEEHLGVSNRNPLWRVDLDGASPLKEKSIRRIILVLVSDRNDNVGGTAEYILSSLFCRAEGFFVVINTIYKEEIIWKTF